MSERYVTNGSATLWTASSGEGLPLLLASGGPGCCDYLAPVAAMIDDLAQVVRFEGRGCGRSSESPPYEVEAALQDLEVIRQHYGFSRWLVGGHSWGADLALLYAVQHPERLMGLVCLAGGRINNDREWHKRYRMQRDVAGEQLPDFAYPANRMVNEALNASWRRFIQRPKLLHRLANLAVPALFVYGSEDIRPSWAVEQVANLMPNAQFVKIHGAAHYLWLTRAFAVRAALRDFMGSLEL